MNKIIFITCLLISLAVNAEKPFKVAIIDTGFSPMPLDDSAMKLCDTGHYDFNTETTTVPVDDHGHGTFVTYLVNKSAKTRNMCYLVYKVFGPGVLNPENAINDAMLKAYKAGAHAINLSLYMRQYSYRTRRIVKMITNRGTKIFVSSGNEARNLNTKCYTYPVCYKGVNKNMVVVGSLDMYGGIASYSNYGAMVDVYEMGDINDARGTSFAAPRALGKYLRSLNWDKRR